MYTVFMGFGCSNKEFCTKNEKRWISFWGCGQQNCKKYSSQTDVIISELAEQYGLETVYTVDRNIPDKVMPSLNSPTNESGKTVTTITMEHIVVLRKNI